MPPRQAEIMGLLQEGLSVKEVAAKAGLSENTVRCHIRRMRQKLNCRDLLELRCAAARLPEAGRIVPRQERSAREM